ncbi:MAG: hypothetical protein ABIL25_00815 [candidate division WOR-3 bacterium]
MTKLHFNYKDVFRSLRLGFSAKKIWMMFIGLLVGFAGYGLLTYLAYLAAGCDLVTVWEAYRLLPFPEPFFATFPWYSWTLYGIGVLLFIASVLLSGTAVSKVTFEQLRGDEFYESREAFRFAFRQWSSVLGSPALVLAFILIIAVFGLILSALGAIPYFGEMFVALLAVPALAASFFILYLGIVLAFGLLIGPSIVGATKNDTFDTIFEVFSCANEQPARLCLYLGTAAGLAKVGTLAFGVATSLAVRIGHFILALFMGGKLSEAMSNAAYYFKVALPSWTPGAVRSAFESFANIIGVPQLYLPGEYVSVNWAGDVAALLIGVALYCVAVTVLAYGCSVWYSANTLTYVVLARKKDEKNLLESPEEEELIEPANRTGAPHHTNSAAKATETPHPDSTGDKGPE